MESTELPTVARRGHEVLANLSSSQERRFRLYQMASQKDKVYVVWKGFKPGVYKTWAECEARVRGKKAKFKKALSAEEEAQIIAEFSVLE